MKKIYFIMAACCITVSSVAFANTATTKVVFTNNTTNMEYLYPIASAGEGSIKYGTTKIPPGSSGVMYLQQGQSGFHAYQFGLSKDSKYVPYALAWCGSGQHFSFKKVPQQCDVVVKQVKTWHIKYVTCSVKCH